MKAIGYIRVSTEQQAGEGVSLEAQRGSVRRARSYLSRHGPHGSVRKMTRFALPYAGA